ncbi:MAG: hypothetical protein RBS39_11480 [Phycisphaerales bacterium]|nr:hypothetical protein [Phycisphaerales bacterium]
MALALAFALPALVAGRASAQESRADQAIVAWKRVRAMVDAWEAPLRAESSTPGADAVAVVLRYEGRVVGRGVAVSAGGRDDALSRATSQALDRVESSLRIVPDATWPERSCELSARLMVSLELAGNAAPCPPEKLESPWLGAPPATRAVIVRARGQSEAMFPEAMINSGLDASSAARGLASRVVGASGALRPLPEITRTYALDVLLAPVTHVAQLEPAGPPVFLHRAARPIAPGSTDARAIAELRTTCADALARMLAAPRDTPGSAIGASTWFERGLASLAIAWHAVNLPEGNQRDAAIALIAAQVEAASQQPDAVAKEAPATAAVWSALLRMPLGIEAVALRSACDGALDDARRPGVTIPDIQLGYVAWALCVRAGAGDLTPEDAEPVLRSVYESTPPGLLVTHWPWLVWGENELAHARGDGAIPALPAIRAARDAVWKSQLSPGEATLDERDLLGAFVFTAGGERLPDWQTLRPLAAMVDMLADDRFTPSADRPMELVRILDALRFVRQLQITPDAMWASGDAGAFPGALRGSPWTSAPRVPPTAYALITAVELERSLAEMSARSKP